MNPKELELAAIDTVKMLQHKPMPYNWTKLATDTHYTFDDRRQISDYLKTHGFIKTITPFAFILSEKGKQAHARKFKVFDMTITAFAAVILGVLLSLAIIHVNDPGNVRINKSPQQLMDSVFVTR